MPTAPPTDPAAVRSPDADAPEKFKHPIARTLIPSIPIGALIGYVDVQVLEDFWPTMLALFIAAFFITYLTPSRWLSTAFTLTCMMWIAFAWVRVPWWDHPDEVGAFPYSAALVVLPSFFGAVLAAQIQCKRGKL